MDKEKTIVIFRKFKKRGDIIALFPYEMFDTHGHCMSYQHIGQHGGADYEGCISMSRAACTWEYANLKIELERIGYNLDVRKRKGNVFKGAAK